MLNKFKSISWIGLGLISLFGLNVVLVLAALLLDHLWLNILAILVSVLQLFLHHKLSRHRRKFKIHSRLLNLRKSHHSN
ncbi:membrane protein YdbS with pleckstrin-like domain [Pedobacter cryoconitis]|uniref:Membrane protein YdbS with pleckstrin-like domain n=1 Tax=Pedobacter cryoconitis TaxID=188932 RepID=A0A7W8YTV6_9SPHI|nr:hypothetical protein [Pedobacter cryoconitis]MBB5621695.1 membrane protein YdbS with pleckstrin-like domain [Pedobacter cryoconitis]MBB5644184.1 membrane protein YdbS with pleckstrin-like domain [Pedobacter cryoconitis]